jgi:hypothetical protein
MRSVADRSLKRLGRCFLKQNFLDSLAPGATDSYGKARNLEFRSRWWHIAQLGKNKSANSIDPFGIDLKTEMLA